MVGLGIATGFERQYGVLKRLGSTPLGRPRLLGAKTASIVAVEILQVVVLVAVAVGLGWNPLRSSYGAAALAMLLATVAFAGLGLLMARHPRGEMVLAAANGLYLVLLLLGGMVVPLAKLPRGPPPRRPGPPAGALSDALPALGGAAVSHVATSWLVLAAWAVAAPLAAARASAGSSPPMRIRSKPQKPPRCCASELGPQNLQDRCRLPRILEVPKRASRIGQAGRGGRSRGGLRWGRAV